MKSVAHTNSSPSSLSGPESFLAEISRREALQTSPGESGWSVVAFGERRSFLRAVEDAAQATDRPFRHIPAGQEPRWCGSDVVVIEAGAASSLARFVDKTSRKMPRPRQCVIAGVPGGVDPWSVMKDIPGDWGTPDVVLLPQGRTWLADRISAATSHATSFARIGFVGACGGVGTTSIAIWTALRMKDDGLAPIVIDAAPGSVALDACMSADPVSGVRWGELQRLPSVPDGARILASLPSPHGIPVLAEGLETTSHSEQQDWHRYRVVNSLASQAPLVIDCGTGSGLPASRDEDLVMTECSCLVVVTPFTLRGMANAQVLICRWRQRIPVLVVASGPRWCDVSGREAAQFMGVESLAAVIPHLSSAAEAYEAGQVLELAYRRPLRRPIADLVDAIRSAVAEPLSSGRRMSTGAPRLTGIAAPGGSRFSRESS